MESSTESTTNEAPKSRGIPPWMSAWNFIARPDLFFKSIAAAPRLWYPFLIAIIIGLAVPDYACAHVCLVIRSMPVLLQSLISVLFLLWQNTLYAALALGLAKMLGDKASYKTMFVACSFAQLPYLLLTIPADGVVFVTVAWSFLLTITAVQQCIQTSWFKVFGVQTILFAVSFLTIQLGGNFIGSFIYAQVGELAGRNSTPKENVASSVPEPVTAPSDDIPQMDYSEASGEVDEMDREHPMAPNVTFHLVDKNPVKLSSLKGKVVVIDFWATWCPPCQLTLPVLSRLNKQYKSKGVEFIAIDSDESENVAKAFLKSHRFDLPLALDDDKANKFAFGAHVIPFVAIIDRKGHVEMIQEGYEPGEEKTFSAAIDKALAR